jgi:hypothetical protein
MNGRRPLGETLGEIAGSALGINAGAGSGSALVNVTSIDVELPLDLRLGADAAGPILVGDVPLFRMRTAFDTEPSRLTVRFEAQALDAVL